MTDPVIRSIPLNRLGRSPANVRRTEAGKTAFAELKASILAHGLPENLVARSIGPGEDGGEHFVVIAGARRLAVLNDLASDGVLDADHPIPCRIIGNGAIDSELSLAENVIRVAMHPADQVQAFGTLANDGAGVADTATRQRRSNTRICPTPWCARRPIRECRKRRSASAHSVDPISWNGSPCSRR